MRQGERQVIVVAHVELVEEGVVHYEKLDGSTHALAFDFAPPDQISRPRTSTNGTVITPVPPCTGMPSRIAGKLAATNIEAMVTRDTSAKVHTASMADMGAACAASAGSGLHQGSAAPMTVYPVVGDLVKHPSTGRSLPAWSGRS